MILRKYQRIRTNYSGATLGKMTRPDPGYSQNVPTMENYKKGRNGRGCGQKPLSQVAQATGQACTTMLSLWTERNQDGNPNSF